MTVAFKSTVCKAVSHGGPCRRERLWSPGHGSQSSSFLAATVLNILLKERMAGDRFLVNYPLVPPWEKWDWSSNNNGQDRWSQSSCPAHPWGAPEFLNSNSLRLGIPVKPRRGVANHLSLCPSPRLQSNRFSPFHLLQLRQFVSHPIPSASPSPLLFRNAMAP